MAGLAPVGTELFAVHDMARQERRMFILRLFKVKCICEMLSREEGGSILMSVAYCINNGLTAVHRVSPVRKCGFNVY